MSYRGEGMSLQWIVFEVIKTTKSNQMKDYALYHSSFSQYLHIDSENTFFLKCFHFQSSKTPSICCFFFIFLLLLCQTKADKAKKKLII